MRVPGGALLQAVLHLLLAARGRAESSRSRSRDGSLTVSPAARESLGALVADRIAVDHGGTSSGATSCSRSGCRA